MKLKNVTRYDGRDLRGLFLACARRWRTAPPQRTIRVDYYAPRQRFVDAFGTKLRMIRPERLIARMSAVDQLGSVGKGELVLPEPAFVELCSIVMWYVRPTTPSTWYRTRPDWAGSRRVRIKPAPARPERLTGVAYQKAEIAKAETRLATWEKKQRRAATAIKKLKRELRERRGRIKRARSQR